MSNWIQIFWWKLHKHYFYLILSQKWQAFHLTPAVVVRSKNCWLNSCISVIIFFILSKHQFIKFLLAAWLFQVHSFMSERNPEIAKFCWYQKWVFLYGPNCFATWHKLTSFGLIFITLPQLFLVDQTNIPVQEDYILSHCITKVTMSCACTVQRCCRHSGTTTDLIFRFTLSCK